MCAFSLGESEEYRTSLVHTSAAVKQVLYLHTLLGSVFR